MKKRIFVPTIILAFATVQAYSQSNEIIDLLHDFANKAAAGTPLSFDQADPVLDRLTKASAVTVKESLPTIFQNTASPYVSVRRLSAMALFSITLRPDGQALLSAHTDTFSATLIDSDIPIRRMTGLIIENLHLDHNSPLVPSLEAFLSREDAVATIGGGVAGSLLHAAPDDPEGIAAVVRYMKRKDHTQASRAEVLQSVSVARSQNREIGKEVASYADDSSNITSRQALETLEGMGTAVLSENQLLIQRIAADNGRDPSVRTAAKKALSTLP